MKKNTLELIKTASETGDIRGRLSVPYAALKTMVAENTGAKTQTYTLRVSAEDMQIAMELADALGISVSSLYRQLVVLARAERANAEWEAGVREVKKDLAAAYLMAVDAMEGKLAA
jgi:hypothetical protein